MDDQIYSNSDVNALRIQFQMHFIALHELARQIFAEHVEKASLQFKIVRILEQNTEEILSKIEELQSNFSNNGTILIDCRAKLKEKDENIEILRSDLEQLRTIIEFVSFLLKLVHKHNF